MQEQVVWTGNASQLTGLATYLCCGVLALAALVFAVALSGWFLLLVPVGAALAAVEFIRIKSLHYEVTNQRLRMRRGILSRRWDEVELYRIKDTAFVEPFLQRLFGLGSIELRTSDRTLPAFIIPAITNAAQLREQIRGHVERLRQEKGVRELDMR